MTSRPPKPITVGPPGQPTGAKRVASFDVEKLDHNHGAEAVNATNENAERLYNIAFVIYSDGSFDIIEQFMASDDAAANSYAEKNYPDDEWYVLNAAGRNINA